MAESLVLERRIGRVRVLSLNRPQHRNAMVPTLVDELRAALERHEPGMGLVLAAEGGSFCPGADLRWLGESRDPGQAVAELVAGHHAVVRVMQDVPGPIVAAVHGAAAGGGLSLALAADYRVASTDAQLRTAYFALGLPPDGGNSTFLVRMLGRARAMELLLLNQALDAETARAWGLVNEVTSREALVDRAAERAEELARVPAATLLATRQLLDAAGAQPLRTQLQREGLAMREAARREEFHRALSAFLRDRGPAEGA